MSYRYRMTLKPLAPFFFGREHTFGADEARNEGSRYYARSTHFPQQSALLGMLRKTMLIQAGHMTLHKKGEWVDGKKIPGRENTNHARAKALCGDGAFSYAQDFDTGTIVSLSPLFVRHGDHDCIPEPRDAQWEPRVAGDVAVMLGQERADSMIVLDGYDPKSPGDQKWVSPGGQHFTFDEIFVPLESVGIKKGQGGQTEEKGFFMKRSYVFGNETAFAAILDVSEEIEWSEAMVTLGADQSPFMLTLEAQETDYDDLFAPVVERKNLSRIVALSDMLVSSEAYQHASFVLGERFAVRHIERHKDTGYAMKKSRPVYLLGRGSVLYGDDAALAIIGQQLGASHLRKVGLNHFITVPGGN